MFLVPIKAVKTLPKQRKKGQKNMIWVWRACSQFVYPGNVGFVGMWDRVGYAYPKQCRKAVLGDEMDGFTPEIGHGRRSQLCIPKRSI